MLAFAIWFGLGCPATGSTAADHVRPAASRLEHASHCSRPAEARASSTARPHFSWCDYAKGLKTLKAGEYKFDQPANAFEVWRRLTQGDVYARTVVVPEGYNIYDIASAVEQAGLGSGFRLPHRRQERSVPGPRHRSRTRTSLEGYLFPDTYQFTRIDSAHEIAAAMVHRFRQEAQKIGLLGRYRHCIAS